MHVLCNYLHRLRFTALLNTHKEDKKMIRTAICDDNTLHLNYTQNLVRNLLGSASAIALYDNAHEFADILENESPIYDMVLLDIDLGNVSGIKLARKINEINPFCQIIFISGYLNYALEVYDTKHTYFIIKTEIKKRLPAAVEKAIANLNAVRGQALIVRQRNKMLSLDSNDILYLERDKRVTVIHTADNEYSVYEKLNELHPRLHSDDFVICHNSYIVNLNKVKEFDKNEFVLINGNSVPISRNYHTLVKEKFLKFTGEHL